MLSLAFNLRPKTMQDFIGQKHLIGENGVFRKFLTNDKFPHSFFFGPPGTGKTTLARIIANMLGRVFYEFNASSLKIEDIRKVVEKHKNSLEAPLIFIDEAHRLNKSQQDVLLPIMEEGRALILGASTENPFFALTNGIRSRIMLFELFSLNLQDLLDLIKKASIKQNLTVDDDAAILLATLANGDARALLKLLEYATVDSKVVTKESIESLGQKALFDGASEDETHYNLASAMIKSIRGSDPDAAIYYLARLIAGGEEPRFIARRLAILASEDIGNANPNAITIANSIFEIVANIGYPEARIPLAQLAIYLACSPKSNSAYLAIDKALAAIANGEILEIPDYLKDTNSATKRQNRGKNYLYPHDFGGYVKQEYMKKPLKFVELNKIGFEKTLFEWLEKIRG